MKKCIQNMDVANKRVVLRVDFNVPIQNGVILDDLRIRESLKTIQYLIEQNCRIVILSHLGKVKTLEDKKKNSLDVVVERLKQLLSREVYFSRENFGIEVTERVSKMNPQDILVLENTRFLDVSQKLESGCDSQLSLFWASLGDVFCNDAFGSSHRRHASTYGITKYLPSCIGFLVQKELEALDRYILNPVQPFTVIMGGAKMDDKISLIQALIPKCSHVLCGGGIANTCLKALGFEIGESISSAYPIILDQVKDLLLHHKEKFVVPLDAIVSNTYDKNYIQYKLISSISPDDLICDVGTKTLEKYRSIIKNSKTIFLNGTIGLYEDMRFANGTKELFSVLKESSATIIVGGGDAASSIRMFGFSEIATYISSGGGATLEYLANGSLSALDGIDEEGPEIEVLDL